MADPTPPGRPLYCRALPWLAAIALLAGGGWAAYLAWLRYTPQPVVPTTLELKGVYRLLAGGNNWRNLPFTLTSEAEAAVTECERIGRTVTFNGQIDFGALRPTHLLHSIHE